MQFLKSTCQKTLDYKKSFEKTVLCISNDYFQISFEMYNCRLYFVSGKKDDGFTRTPGFVNLELQLSFYVGQTQATIS